MERGQESFDKISRMIKEEMGRFEKSRIHDFKIMFIEYLENHLKHQAQVSEYSFDTTKISVVVIFEPAVQSF